MTQHSNQEERLQVFGYYDLHYSLRYFLFLSFLPFDFCCCVPRIPQYHVEISSIKVNELCKN